MRTFAWSIFTGPANLLHGRKLNSGLAAVKLDVEFAGAETDAEIEDFLARACGSLIYYTPAYRRFLGEITESASALTLIARDGGRIVGLLPAFVKKNSQYGDVLNSLPFFGGHGGAIVDEQSARQDEIADTH